VSASRRTDIAAFYAPWFMNRVRAGFCEWKNPFGGETYRVSLASEETAGIVFWTRYPAPLLPFLAELRARGHFFYFHVTVNGYERALEARNPELGKAIDAFHALSDAASPQLVLWRYDPIILSDRMEPGFHLENFERLARRLAGYTGRCLFSFVDYYGKTKRNLARVERETGTRFTDPSLEIKSRLAGDLARIGAAHGVALYACCEDALVAGGVEKAHCVDLELIRLARGGLDLDLKARPSRAGCGCLESVDIGAYDTCRFGCVYCYATNSWEAAHERSRRHDPQQPALLA